ncbi:hypothetical protein EYC84_008351 [Monilinia fructicola]|uniref:Glucose-methanol-choline oxidoreductase N-terminal domain-containing protein n=1 Tax=Monilinia fructicola TaxID=38448 RepID=A0A5M9JLI5_MONFR|nr:hypothetical protein EYC84_008351 [Monilinia fructicola]
MTTDLLSSSQVNDFDYVIVGGNSYIRHSRAKVLGGCSSHNTLISFRPFEYDCQIWESLGCKGWGFKTMMRLIDNLRNQINPVHPRHRNQICKDWVQACSTAMDIPIIHDFNHEIREKGALEQGVANSTSTPNRTVKSVNVTLKSGEKLTVSPKTETILCAGAVDTCRLMLLSGVGPAQQLRDLNIPVVHDLPGVGENLIDHPESIIMWELNAPVPPQTTMDSDAGIFLRRELPNAAKNHRHPELNPKALPDGTIADIMMHCYQIPFCLNTARLGYDAPLNAFCMTPNIPRPRSRGRIYLTSADPSVKPALDFRYFTDPEGYDAATIVAGLKAAREIAKQAPFSNWLLREVAPGPAVQTDEQLSEYGRKVAHTVYHPAGTTKMGSEQDKMSVCDEKLRVRGLSGVRVADAGCLPHHDDHQPHVNGFGDWRAGRGVDCHGGGVEGNGRTEVVDYADAVIDLSTSDEMRRSRPPPPEPVDRLTRLGSAGACSAAAYVSSATWHDR